MENPVQPDAPKALTDAQVEALARDKTQSGPVYHLNDGENDYDLDLGQYPESEIERLNQRILELQIEALAEADAAKGDAEIAEEDAGEGYTLVDAVTNGEDYKRIALSGLEPKVVLEFDAGAQRGVSAAFDDLGSGNGAVHLRVLADHNSRAALSRKDENGVTHLKVHFHSQEV